MMLPESAAALAAAAGSGLVTAMVSDAWEEVRARAVRLLGRGDRAEEARQERRLEHAHADVAGAPEERAREIREAQAVAWRTRFADLLEETPEVHEKVRELVRFVAEEIGGTTAAAVQVNAHAHDQAQQAVQGQGTQHVVFGRPPATPQ